MNELEIAARALVRARHRTCCEKRDFSTYTLSPFDIEETKAVLASLIPPSDNIRNILGKEIDDYWTELGVKSLGSRAFDAAIQFILAQDKT